jgi:hypothetical protein
VVTGSPSAVHDEPRLTLGGAATHTSGRPAAGLEARASSFGRVPLTAATVTCSKRDCARASSARLRNDEEGE